MPPPLWDFVWKFQISLRKLEYYSNLQGGFFCRILRKYYYHQYKLFSILCGFSIPINTFGKGLSIAHRGTIVVNSSARIGDNCRLHVGVNIGTVPGCSKATPTIGNNCYIGPGAKIYGKINIADGIIIGANSVVNKDFNEPNICIAGVPAKKISNLGSKEMAERNREAYKNYI